MVADVDIIVMVPEMVSTARLQEHATSVVRRSIGKRRVGKSLVMKANVRHGMRN